MGVIINETITLANGLTVTNPYASVGGNDIKVEKRVQMNPKTTRYITEGVFTMWVSHELRVSGSRDIGNFRVEIESKTPPTGNIYELLYNKLKTMKTCTESI
jgi:hypothetical protein